MSWEAALAAQSFSGGNLVRGLPPLITLSTVLGGSPGPKIALVSGRNICIKTSNRSAVCWLMLPELAALGLSLAQGGEALALISEQEEEAGIPPLNAPIYYVGNSAHDINNPAISYLASDVSVFSNIPKLQAALTSAGLKFIDLRSLMPQLSPEELSRAGHAVAVSQWHAMHPFCPRCGAKTIPILGGAKRQCVNDPSHRQYPRTDPVIISLVVSPGAGDKALLGRSNGLREGTLTCLSGFIDQNESIEEAVVREVREESGISVNLNSVRVLGSQPWPIGRGGSCELMIGCIAQAASEVIEIDPREMAECRWVGRDEVKAALERSTSPESPFISGKLAAVGESDSGSGFYVPPPFAIAYHLIKYWIEMENTNSTSSVGRPQNNINSIESNL